MTLSRRVDGDVDPPTEFRVGMKTRFFNWSLDRAIRAQGWTRNQAAAELGIGLPTLYNWLAFSNYPRADKALEVAVVLGVSDEILFPEEIKGFRITKQPEPISFGRDEALELGMLSQDVDPEELAIQGELADGINKVMQTITDREKLVLTLRFGLDGGEAKRLVDVGAILGVSRERIRQIEDKALRKLRHPSRAWKLRDYVTEERWAATTDRYIKVMATYKAEKRSRNEEFLLALQKNAATKQLDQSGRHWRK